jgi:hypothetical protein
MAHPSDMRFPFYPLLLALFLTACGGDGADSATQVPDEMHTEAFAAHHDNSEVHHDSLHAPPHTASHTAAHEAHHAAMHGDTSGMHHDGMHEEGMHQQGMHEEGMHHDGTDSETVQATMQDGVQRLSIEARTTGYEPARIQLRKGVPARITFTRITRSPCMTQVQIPEFGVSATDLPLNEPVTVEFTPDATGTFTFVCGMDMQTGTMMVGA